MDGPVPRIRLNPEFVAAVLASPITNCALAQRAGFAHPSNFSSLLHAQLVLASPTTAARLKLVAAIINFSGDIFLEEHPPVSAAKNPRAFSGRPAWNKGIRKPDTFSLDDLPSPAK